MAGNAARSEFPAAELPLADVWTFRRFQFSKPGSQAPPYTRAEALRFMAISPAQQQLQVSSQEFVSALRSAIEGYFSAVDRWEAAYQKYYRMPGYPPRIDDDLAAEQHDYNRRQRALAALLPRARRLCLRHGVRDSFCGLLRISLGRYAPQERMDSAMGRSERNLATICLIELRSACQEWPEGLETREPKTPQPKRGLLRRLIDYFY